MTVLTTRIRPVRWRRVAVALPVYDADDAAPAVLTVTATYHPASSGEPAGYEDVAVTDATGRAVDLDEDLYELAVGRLDYVTDHQEGP